MAQRYAKDQPAGFTNRIERVAIVGVGGSVGQHLTEALLKTGKHTVTAITRAGSTSKIPEGVEVATVDYDDEASLVAALTGQQFLAISMASTAHPDTQAKLIKAADKAGVAWVMPNGYGIDYTHDKLAEESLTAPSVIPGINAAKETNFSSFIVMVCSFWYEFSLAQTPGYYGFDIANRKVTFFDDGKYRIPTSTWLQCGRALASLLSLRELPEDEHDKSVTISNWRNKPLYIKSFFINQREMLDSVQRVSGETDKDWTIEYEPSVDRWNRAMGALKNGDRSVYTTAMYSRIFFPNGDSDFRAKGLANETLGLPEEDLDEATQRALDLVKSGYNYMTRRG